VSAEAKTELGKDSKITLALAFTFFGIIFGGWKWLDARFQSSKDDIASQLRPLADAQVNILMRIDRMESSANGSREEIKDLRETMKGDVSEIEFENWSLRLEKTMQPVHPGLEIPPLKHQ